MRAQAPCPHATPRSAAPTAGCRCQGPSPLRLPWDLRGPLPGAPGADPPFTALRPGPLRVLAATATKPDCEMQTTACLVKGGVITGVSLGSPVPGTPTQALPQAGPLPPTGRSRAHTPSEGDLFTSCHSCRGEACATPSDPRPSPLPTALASRGAAGQGAGPRSTRAHPHPTESRSTDATPPARPQNALRRPALPLHRGTHLRTHWFKFTLVRAQAPAPCVPLFSEPDPRAHPGWPRTSHPGPPHGPKGTLALPATGASL